MEVRLQRRVVPLRADPVDPAAAQARALGAGHIQLRTDRDWVTDIARFVLNYRRVAGMLHQPPQGVSK